MWWHQSIWWRLGALKASLKRDLSGFRGRSLRRTARRGAGLNTATIANQFPSSMDQVSWGRLMVGTCSSQTRFISHSFHIDPSFFFFWDEVSPHLLAVTVYRIQRCYYLWLVGPNPGLYPLWQVNARKTAFQRKIKVSLKVTTRRFSYLLSVP